MASVAYAVEEAERFLAEGTPAVADLMLWEILGRNPRDGRAWGVMARVAAAIGERDLAERYGRVAEALSREKGEAGAAPGAASDERFLVIKAWGFGFWSDVDMVLGGLLLSEMTGRTPVTFWGGNSLFNVDAGQDAWGLYFEPVSGTRVEALIGKGYNYFPPKWNDGNLRRDPVDKVEGPYARMSGLHLLNRPERVAVHDHHTAVVSLLPWLPAAHPMAGRDLEEVYRYLMAKHARPVAAIREQVQIFAATRLTKRPVIAVHARGSDKPQEDSTHSQWLAMYPQAIAFASKNAPDARILLLTESESIAREYAQRYGSRLILPPALRTAGVAGPHYVMNADRRRLGMEVVRDVYLAAECDAFVGTGTSNVACAINHVKAWAPGTATVMGPMITSKSAVSVAMSWEQLERRVNPAWVVGQKRALREGLARRGVPGVLKQS